MVASYGTAGSPKTPTTAFNYAAAAEIYKRDHTLVRDEPGFLASTKKFFGGDLGDVDTDKTMKTSDVDTNLDAIAAGYKGTSAEASVTGFVDILKKHPDLKDGADAMLKDEGEKLLPAISEIFTGNGAIKMEDLAAMAESPAKRQMMVSMMQAVGTNKFGPDYAVRFIKDGIDASQNSGDAKKVNKFFETAAEAGIDTTGVKTESAMDALRNLFTGNNMENGIANFIDKLGLSPDMKEALTGLMTGFAKFFKESGEYYAYGDGSTPGLIDIGQRAMAATREAGQEARLNAGLPAPAATP